MRPTNLYQWLRTLHVVCADLVAVCASVFTAVLLRIAWGGSFDPSDKAAYYRSFGCLLLFPMTYALFGQYSPVAHNPVREVRQLTKATTLVFVMFAVLLFFLKAGPAYSRAAFLGAWILTLVLVPCARAAIRKIFSRSSWWSYPVAVFGTYDSAQQLIEGLQAQPETGLRPAAAFLTEGHRGETIHGVPILDRYTSAPLYARRLKLNRAIVLLSDIPVSGLPRMLESYANVFSHVYLMPGLGGLSSFGVQALDICDGVALELRRSLLLPRSRFTKRVVDIAVSAVLLIVLFPVLLVIALLIRLESPGGILFAHRRIGQGGRKFKMWKFRTMYSNSADILKEHLRRNPIEEQHWRQNMKLRKDPRITRLGAILRKTSVDELPQLWNVLCGDMSLVGPRPIVSDEVNKYGEWFGLYCLVVPGLTGLWQVSGRSRTSYERRVELDTYYVRNWSPWLDVYLLARTVPTVLQGEGAY